VDKVRLQKLKTWTAARVERLLLWAGVRRKVFVPVLWVFIGLWSVAAFAGCHASLTDRHSPATVSVRGYTRRDGTTVRPYNRRPPGVAAADSRFNGSENEGTEWIRNLILAVWAAGSLAAGFCIVVIPKPRREGHLPSLASRSSNSINCRTPHELIRTSP
jgi:hypothetical protein